MSVDFVREGNMVSINTGPFISVIVPVYNTEQYLSRCLDSILSQCFIDFELLLVDDGSTDGSGAICDKYAAKDNRVRVFHKENGGVSSARNMGLREAKGEWACFVDSDDELLLNGLQTMVGGISEEVDLVMSGYETFDDSGNLIYSVDDKASKVITCIDAVKELFEPSDYWYQGYVWCKLFRFSEVRKKSIRFSEEIYFNEDRLFLARFICAMEKGVFYTTIPVYMYFERSGGAMMSLKENFNTKFVTDMESQIRIRECVRFSFDSLELLKLADFEVYKSYRRIVGMMKEFRYNDIKLSARLYKQLIGAIGFASFFKYEIKRNKRRLANKIKKQ